MGRHLLRVGQSGRGSASPRKGAPVPEGREGDHGETPEGLPHREMWKDAHFDLANLKQCANPRLKANKNTKVRQKGVGKKSPFLSVSSPASGAGTRPRLPHVVRPHHSAAKTDTEIHRTRALLRRSSAHRGDRSCSSSFRAACGPQHTGEGTLPGSVITWPRGPSRRLAFSEVAVCPPPAQAGPAGTMSSRQARHISWELGLPRSGPAPSITQQALALHHVLETATSQPPSLPWRRSMSWAQNSCVCKLACEGGAGRDDQEPRGGGG